MVICKCSETVSCKRGGGFISSASLYDIVRTPSSPIVLEDDKEEIASRCHYSDKERELYYRA